MDLFIQAFSNPFFLTAILTGVITSIAGGIIGSYVVVKRIVFISGSISHALLGGIGLFLYLQNIFKIPWLSPLLGALIIAILFGLIIGIIHLKYKQREDTVIACIWSFGMALGVIFISQTPGSNSELVNFLFGNILWTTATDFYAMLILDAVIIITTLVFHKKFLAICFDEKIAYLQKVPVKTYYFTLISLIAITVVMMVQTIGAILVITLLCLPAAIANLFCKKLSSMMLLACIISIIFTILSFFVSFLVNWPPGATLGLLITLAFPAFFLIRKKRYA